MTSKTLDGALLARRCVLTASWKGNAKSYRFDDDALERLLADLADRYMCSVTTCGRAASVGQRWCDDHVGGR